MLKKTAKKAASIVGAALSRTSNRHLLNAMSEVSKRFDMALNNVNFEFSRNGELRVLQTIAEQKPSCIFDVGANVGEYTRMALRLCDAAVVHSFEVVPKTFATLVSSTSSDRVRLVNKGLSDRAGTVQIHLSREDSSTATAFKIEGMQAHDEYYAGGMTYECVVTTGCDYMTENDIDSVDLLKVDVEGMDYRVLAGFGDLLPRVRVIQFEYGVFNISSRDLLIDFYKLLTKHGFAIGKIMPRGVAFAGYFHTMENFYGNNYLAVKHGESALMSKLGL